MGEMDIYMRRRLVALGGLVAFFIFFVLLVKSCGGDDEPATTTTTVGATGGGGAIALTKQEFIAQADAICAEANSAVGALDPTDPNATRRELQITSQEVEQLQALEVEEEDNVLRRFMGHMDDLVDALRSKQAAIQQGDTVAEGEAQVAIDTAEVEARALGERYGFRDCGQFLDAGEAPGGAATGTEAPPATDPATGGVTPPADTGTVPPADTGTAPPADTGTAPPAGGGGDTGGITP